MLPPSNLLSLAGSEKFSVSSNMNPDTYIQLLPPALNAFNDGYIDAQGNIETIDQWGGFTLLWGP